MYLLFVSSSPSSYFLLSLPLFPLAAQTALSAHFLTALFGLAQSPFCHHHYSWIKHAGAACTQRSNLIGQKLIGINCSDVQSQIKTLSSLKIWNDYSWAIMLTDSYVFVMLCFLLLVLLWLRLRNLFPCIKINQNLHMHIGSVICWMVVLKHKAFTAKLLSLRSTERYSSVWYGTVSIGTAPLDLACISANDCTLTWWAVLCCAAHHKSALPLFPPREKYFTCTNQ